MSAPDLDDLITVNAACAALGVTPRTIFNWRRRRLVDAIYLAGGRRVYLSKRQLASLLVSESDAAHAARARAREALSR